MASIEVRGYINNYEKKVSGSGTEYSRYKLASQQKRKDKSGQQVVEKVYYSCVDFSGKEPPGLHEGSHGLTAYVGIKGYLTVTGWCKDGKGGANLDVTVKEYEALEQNTPAAKTTAAPPPADPFADIPT